MKNIAIIILGLTLLGCKADSYYSARNINHQRFDGWKEANAQFLMETSDQMQLLENLSALALERAKLKNTYTFSEEAYPEIKNLMVRFHVEAAVKRVKLSSVLSEDRMKKYHEVKSLEDDFDKYYLFQVKETISEIQYNINEYQDNGHNEGLKDFAMKIENTIHQLEESLDENEIGSQS